MQAEINRIKPEFQPVTVTLVLETPQELRALGVLSNYTPIVDACHVIGFNFTPLFDALPAGAYSVSDWDEDVAPLAHALSNHPALDVPSIDIIVEETVDLMDEDEAITCTIVDVNGSAGRIEVSDGRSYEYGLAGCGEAIRIRNMDGDLLTEVPTSKYGTSTLSAEDVEVITAVLAQIS